jgi:hypothetical protein
MGLEETVTFRGTLVDGTPTDDGLTLTADNPTLDVLESSVRWQYGRQSLLILNYASAHNAFSIRVPQ